MSPALAGGFLTTAPPGKPQQAFLEHAYLKGESSGLKAELLEIGRLWLLPEKPLPWLCHRLYLACALRTWGLVVVCRHVQALFN